MLGIDFFCGAGGTTCGLLSAGVDIICGVDNDLSAKSTYEQNRRQNGTSCAFLHKSVPDLTAQDLTLYLANRGDTPLLFSACPPCQPFTNLKTDKGAQGDSAQLALRFLEQIRRHTPDYVLMENVPGIRHKKYGTIFDEFVEGLENLGYDLDFGILNARDFGVPQSRRRMILIASRLDMISLPEPTHGPYRTLPYVPACTAFRFPPIPAGGCYPTVLNHRSSNLTDINLRRIQGIHTPGGSRCDWNDEELELECYRNHDGHTDVYGRINPVIPSPTLTTRFNSLSNGRFGHPTEDRAISLREGAALQTFPDHYIFCAVNMATIARHIGNAVPVLFATALGHTILLHHARYVQRHMIATRPLEANE